MADSDIIEIKAKLWNGHINLRVVLAYKDQKVEYLCTIYRNSYITLKLPAIVEYFSAFVQGLSSKQLWFEYEGVPIKWNLPVGLLYDYLHLPSLLGNFESSSSWTVYLRYDDYPSDYIIPFIYKKDDGTVDFDRSLKEVIVNQLKQSCFVLNGNSKPIMSLSEANSIQLWVSIVDHNLSAYTSINKKIVPKDKAQKIPVRIFIPGTTTIVQAPIYPYGEEEPTSMRDVLSLHLPHLFAEREAIALPYIHGIDTQSLLDEPLLKTWEIFKHLDNFLYVVVIPRV
ncbi:predicted protein [Scheffersomyces stipitis CBS 6054]|uniref:Autophagy protein 5 n=1 Tax=Scheffersomyces stipitis (strain ATCC 58785 / CBS 6054 / NBRC 10063 / NRRL Y-11545) TaxID=322104 RepID=ATG5_PICST|nr:predicted protein [Scheffersomyces stipitis CBS 6054]A3LR68.2 RecName: Full=Autophagy protein 5 [Scheffersomyces stipitis CBS 6054]ABN65685.2 predicted protein [Scheffersomyces stipitis CBS 6054]KAG2733680.1 hypothetical protein G9P44_003205 [Scheffersomyces stipitis]